MDDLNHPLNHYEWPDVSDEDAGYHFDYTYTAAPVLVDGDDINF